MTDYRLYFLDAKGHIQNVEELTCSGDDDAVRAASSRADGRAMELWQRDRRLCAFTGVEADVAVVTSPLAPHPFEPLSPKP